MPNVGGPANRKRVIIGTVATSKLLYAASVWADLGTKTVKNRDNGQSLENRRVAHHLCLPHHLHGRISGLSSKDFDQFTSPGMSESTPMVRRGPSYWLYPDHEKRGEDDNSHHMAEQMEPVYQRQSHRSHQLLPDITWQLNAPDIPKTYYLTQYLTDVAGLLCGPERIAGGLDAAVKRARSVFCRMVTNIFRNKEDESKREAENRNWIGGEGGVHKVLEYMHKVESKPVS